MTRRQRRCRARTLQKFEKRTRSRAVKRLIRVADARARKGLDAYNQAKHGTIVLRHPVGDTFDHEGFRRLVTDAKATMLEVKSYESAYKARRRERKSIRRMEQMTLFLKQEPEFEEELLAMARKVNQPPHIRMPGDTYKDLAYLTYYTKEGVLSEYQLLRFKCRIILKFPDNWPTFAGWFAGEVDILG